MDVIALRYRFFILTNILLINGSTIHKQRPNTAGDTDITNIHFSVFRKLITMQSCGGSNNNYIKDCLIKQNKVNAKVDYMETQKERRFYLLDKSRKASWKRKSLHWVKEVKGPRRTQFTKRTNLMQEFLSISQSLAM